MLTTLLLWGADVPAALATTAAPQQADPRFPVATPQSQGLDPAALNKLVEAVQGYFDSEQIVGAELVVIKNRHTVLHEAIGWVDQEDKIPYKKNQVVNIRSMTKPLTGAGIHLLIDQGKLKLADRVSKFIPGFDNEKSRHITIEQLLTHRSGLPLTTMTDFVGGIDSLGSLADAILSVYPDLYAMANGTGERGPQFETGSKFWYSDAGSDVLGAVIEVVSGLPLRQFFKQRLLMPLGMNSSFLITRKDSTGLSRTANLYAGAAGSWTKIWDPSMGPLYPFAWGSQTIYSTPLDYARFLAMWLDDGVVDGNRLLSQQAVAGALKPVSPMTGLGSDAAFPTGFRGLEVKYGQMSVLHVDPKSADETKPMVVGHSGSDGTFAWGWPDRDLMIFYFTQSRGQATGIRLEGEIDKYLINPNSATEIVAIPDRFKPFIGKYTANFGPYRNAIFKVLVQNENLAVDIPGQMVFELHEPDDEGARAFKMTNLVSVTFLRDNGEPAIRMKLTQVSKIPKKTESDSIAVNAPDKYRRFLGTYDPPMSSRKLEILMHNDSLALKSPDGNIITLEEPDSKGRRRFVRDENTAVFFESDEAGNIASMNLHQSFVMPRGEAAAVLIEKAFEAQGLEAAIAKYHELKASDQDEYFFDERSMNSLGYTMINKNNLDAAIAVFKLNVEAYPNSFNVYDSLGEAYMKNGDKELAIKNYQKSLKMNPRNDNARDVLKKLAEN